MANIRIKDLPADGAPKQTDLIPIDLGSTRHATVKAVVESGRPTASKTEAELGVEPQKAMTPLTTKQAIESQVGSTYVPKTVKVNAGTGVAGGGALSGDVTLSLNATSIASLAKADSAIQSVNGKSGNSVTITPSDVGAAPSSIVADVNANTAERHSHTNKAILDATTASFFEADKTKLSGIESGAQVNTVNSVNAKTGAVVLNAGDVGAAPDTLVADINANTTSRHTHSNKAILDATTAAFLAAEKTKLSGIESGAQVNTVASVAGKTGAVTLVKGDVGLGNIDNTSDASKPVSTATQTALNSKANGSVTVSAGSGLTGGGNITANRSIALSAASIASLGKADTALQAPGGSTGQILAKASATDNDVSWVSSEAATAVSYGPQILTETQKTQARANIDAETSYDTKSAAEAANVPSSVNAIRLNGGAALGDGLGGLYIDTDNGSSDTIVSGDGRIWYRVRDVDADRIHGDIDFDNIPDGLVQRAITGNKYSGFDIQQNNSSNPVGVKISPKAGSLWDKGIFQGFTWVSSIRRWFSVWDASGQIAVMRHLPDGSCDICSSDASQYIDHGQTLGHFIDMQGVLWLYTSGVGGRNVVLFKPPTSDGGSINDIRSYEVFPNGWVANTPGPCSDGVHLVTKAWDTDRSDNPYYARFYNIQKLLDGSVGPRFSEFTCEINITPRSDYWPNDGAPTQQAIAADSVNLYIGQSTDNISDTAFISCFSISEGKRLWRREFKVGKEFAATKGDGSKYELEGFAWLLNGSSYPSLWCGIRTRHTSGAGSDMYAMPMEYGDFGSVSTSPYPLNIGLFTGGVSHEILIPSGEYFSIGVFNGMDSPIEDIFRVSGTTRRVYAPTSLYVGTEETIFPSSSTGVRGINFLGDSLGRIVVASDAGVLGNWQKNGSDGAIHEFRRGTTLVGSISVTNSGATYNQTSDEKFKKSNGELSFENAKKILELITIHNFTWMGEYSSGGDDIGAFAQELYKIYPRSVSVGGWLLDDGSEANEGDEGATYHPWGVDYSKLMPVVIRVIQGLLK